MAERQDGPTHRTRPTLLVCTSCKGDADASGPQVAGERLAEASEAAARDGSAEVLRVRCLANCSRGPSVAIRHPGAWTYVFGGIDPDGDAASLIEGARLLAAAPDGLMPWRGRPDCLKRGLIARIPPIDFTGEPA